MPSAKRRDKRHGLFLPKTSTSKLKHANSMFQALFTVPKSGRGPYIDRAEPQKYTDILFSNIPHVLIIYPRKTGSRDCVISNILVI